MTIILILLMAYQVTDEAMHEWLGISMVTLVIVHQVLNRKWYSAIFGSKYNPYRIINSIITILLLISFSLTAISGISMSNHAVPFLYNLINVNTARVMHLAFSHWAFILMGLHIGMHIGVMAAKIKNPIRSIMLALFTVIAGYGFYLFLKSGIINYITFKTHFAFLDYEKPASLVFFENVSMLIFFAFVAHNLANALKGIGKKDNNILRSLVYVMTAIIIGFILNISVGTNDSNNNSWQSNTFQNFETTAKEVLYYEKHSKLYFNK